MAEARKHLTDASDKLKLAVSGLKAVGQEVGALTAGVGLLPLSEAAARVSQGAETATKAASGVMKAAEAAVAAACEAEATVAAAQEAKAEAAKLAAAAVEAAAAAASAAEKAAGAVAALEGKIGAPVPLDEMYAVGQLGLWFQGWTVPTCVSRSDGLKDCGFSSLMAA